MPATVKNHMIIDRYLELVQIYYAEQKDEVVMGSFVTRIQEPLPIQIRRPIKKRKKDSSNSDNRDIRVMFARQQKKSEDSTKVVVLD